MMNLSSSVNQSNAPELSRSTDVQASNPLSQTAGKDFSDYVQLLKDIKSYTQEEALTVFLESVRVYGMDETLHKILIMKNETYLNQHQYRIYQGADGYWRTDIHDGKGGKRRTVRRKTKEALEAYLVEYYYEKDSHVSLRKATLTDLLPDWVLYRRDHTAAENKTIKNNITDFNSYFRNTELANMPIREISAAYLHEFFLNLTKDRAYSKSRITTVKGVLNGIIKLAIRKDIIKFNPLDGVSFKDLTYKDAESQEDNVFTIEDAYKLLMYLETLKNDMYALAIRFFFNAFVRIGEVMALGWSDINLTKREVHICKQLVFKFELHDDLTCGSCEQEVVNHTKSHSVSGIRDEYLTDEALDILMEARELNPDGEFIFMHDGRPLNPNTFNDHIKAACKECEVTYHSSHKIRFYTASTAYDGNNLKLLQKMMGHAKPSTTEHYLRNVKKNEDTSSIFQNLGKNGINA